MSVFQKSASRILAAAILELYPKAKVLNCEEKDFGFYCDIQGISTSCLDQLKEKLLEMMREQREIQSMEMLRDNAQEFLTHQGLDLKLPDEPMISLFKLGDFIDVCSFPHLNNVNQIEAFEILDTESIKMGVRIIGRAFEKKKEVKEFLKRYRLYQKGNWSEVLFKEIDRKICCLPLAEELRDLLKSFFKKELSDFSFVRTGSIAKQQKLGLGKCAEFIWEEISGVEQLITSQPCSSVEDCISSLQFIDKILTIFDFNYRVSLHLPRTFDRQSKELLTKALDLCKMEYQVVWENGDPQVIFAVKDFLGEWRKISSMGITKHFSKKIIERRCVLSLERLMALLLEKGQGNLPFRWCPIQVRILPLGEQNIPYAKEIDSLLNKRVIRSEVRMEKEILTERMRKANSSKIPYVIVVGDREQKGRAISYREGKSQKKESLETFLRKLEKETEFEG